MLAFDDFALELSVDLLEARVVALRGLPRSGRSSVVRRVADQCAQTAVFVAGRSINDANHRSEARRVEAELLGRVAQHGSAQLLVDDLGVVMRSSFGYAFQGALRGLIVDGESAHVIGCLAVLGLSDPTQPRGRRGSPLLAVAHHRFMPWLSRSSLEILADRCGVDPAELLEKCGSNVGLIDRFAQGGAASASAYAASCVNRWVADLAPEDLVELRAVLDGDGTYRFPHDRLAPLLVRHRTEVRLASLVPLDHLMDAMLGSWPDAAEASAARFSARLGNEPRPLWVDRYLLGHPAQLGRFLVDVARRGPPRRLSILTTRQGAQGLSPRDRDSLGLDLTRAEQLGLAVEVRTADAGDVAALHARQLLLQTTGRAFHVPPNDRILGVVPVGNEADSVVSSPDWTLAEAAWRRAKRLDL